MKRSFHLRSETISGAYDATEGLLKLCVSGDLKSTTVAAVHRDMEEVLKSDDVQQADMRLLEMDLTGAALVDSQGLNLLVATLSRMKLRNVLTRIRVARRSVYSTLLSVGLDRHSELAFVQE